MLMRLLLSKSVLVWSLATTSIVYPAGAACCVWKVTGPNGGTLYLGGSVHALKSTDYPLPSAFNRAFDASSRIVFEAEPKTLQGAAKGLSKAGEYRKGDSPKNHVDPRTYDYLRRFFALLKVPEEKFAKYRPWYLALALQSPALHGLSANLGVEGFLEKRARANSKPVSGLESLREGVEIFSGLSDRESEALLLLTFIPAAHGSTEGATLVDAWHADLLARMTVDGFRDFPSLGERVLGARNRNWIPKIERYLQSGQTYFVVTGAAHMGGRGGLLSLLRQRGYRIEQL
jgi:uncharacterized protein YbaP (TraB family)